MNADPLHRRLSPLQYAALKDAARARAVELRAEAMRDAGSWLARQARRAIGALRGAAGRPQAVASTGGPAR